MEKDKIVARNFDVFKDKNDGSLWMYLGSEYVENMATDYRCGRLKNIVTNETRRGFELSSLTMEYTYIGNFPGKTNSKTLELLYG